MVSPVKNQKGEEKWAFYQTLLEKLKKWAWMPKVNELHLKYIRVQDKVRIQWLQVSAALVAEIALGMTLQ